ncbi:MAG: succinate dehydrogenase, hydrophobic membrane anchor protein [Proteobacteria bacterium]|nr:succinate dehydrogenase, hydrophobic membrane anchor protein [Pseudomonadota bacterium]MDA1237381.1 succinate dehydrogenase, hydrophobic membrane anchor protein [Pseudomonadota bacterium]
MTSSQSKKILSGQDSRSGTRHHKKMVRSSIVLVFLMPLFIFSVGPIFGSPYSEVIAFLSRPFNALLMFFSLSAIFVHFSLGVQVLIEDYVRGEARRTLIIVMNLVCYTAIGMSLFALVRILL